MSWTPPQLSKLLISSLEHVPVAVSPMRCSSLQNARGGGHFSVISSKCLFSVKSAVWAPHWAPKSVTYITIVLVSIKSPSSQLTGAFRLYLSQGATAVVHGCSIRALDPNAE